MLEARFQSKTSLVLKIGPTAFVDDDINKFGGVKLTVGDWVFLRPSDGWEIFKRDSADHGSGVCCRLVEDALIKGRVTNPQAIW